MTHIAKIISISNHKGGVGKTCSTCNIGAGLARKGKKILLVDLDPQANLSLSLGIKDAERNVYEIISGRLKIHETIHTLTENLDIIPSHLDLAGAEVELSNKIGREAFLKSILSTILSEYDFVLIDCPPSLGLLTTNALVSSQEVYVPIQTEYLSLQGISKLIDVIEKIKENINRSLILSGIVITQFDSRKILNRDIASAIQEHFGSLVFNTKIRENVALAEAPCKGKDIFRYNVKSNGAMDYESLCCEILDRQPKGSR